MKRLLVTLMVLACALGAQAQGFKDVPADHWAYDAVESLASKGYIRGMPDGTFAGGKTMTRYEFAVVVDKILENMTAAIEANRNAIKAQNPEQVASAAPEVTKADIDRIERLVEEFKAEISAQTPGDTQSVNDKINELSTKYDSLQDEIDKLKMTVESHEAILNDPEGAFETAKSDISTLKKVTISGYVQTRYEGSQGKLHGGTADKPTDPKGTDSFSVRRSRIKVSANPSSKSQVVLQVDLGGTSVTMKDAYLAYKLNDLTTLNMGQIKVPFGHQIVESSSVREMPERCMMISTFFSGERDRGAYLNGAWGKYNWFLGSFNGSGPNTNDSNRDADFVGRLQGSFGDLEIGASGYLGEGYNQGKNSGDKDRYGVDLRCYMNNMTFKAEYIWAKNTELAQTRGFDETINGGYAQIAYNIKPDLTLVANYDRMSKDITSVVDYGLREAYNVGLIKWLDDKTRLKFFYQFNKEEINTVRNNNYTVELITTF